VTAGGKAGAGSWPRSGLFNIALFGWSFLVLLTLWPTILVSRRAMRWSARLWARVVVALLGHLVGLRHDVRGAENLPAGPAVLAAKHQSAWDTVIFYLLFDGPVYVLKKELLAIPIAGWYLRRVGMVAVDRRGGASALKAMIAGVQAALDDGRTVVIFPEGTRTAPGEHRPYHPGVAALYTRLSVPVVPVALNSGLYWPRRAFLKRPGRITLEFLPPMPPGLGRRTFTTALQHRVEDACARLATDDPPVGANSPNH
jgi:1-acyl-sn-glycerol-3-phosphate acyltransferase